MSFEGDCNTIKDDDCLSCFKSTPYSSCSLRNILFKSETSSNKLRISAEHFVKSISIYDYIRSWRIPRQWLIFRHDAPL